MNTVLPLLFATVAAVGNAMFALGQKQSSGVGNSLSFVAVSALVATLLSLVSAPLLGPSHLMAMVRDNVRPLALGGVGLYLTYLGFNLLYARFGASQYVLYAMISIVTTTVVVGFWLLKEPVNLYHVGAIGAALIAVVLFSLGQARA